MMLRRVASNPATTEEVHDRGTAMALVVVDRLEHVHRQLDLADLLVDRGARRTTVAQIALLDLRRNRNRQRDDRNAGQLTTQGVAIVGPRCVPDKQGRVASASGRAEHVPCASASHRPVGPFSC